MELNGTVFPSPSFDFRSVNEFKDDLIFIPSRDNNDKVKYYIPCLFLRSNNKLCKNFILFFHGNAEDIFLAQYMAASLWEKLDMNLIIIEYPGYSIYKGEPNADKILENTSIVYDFIKNQFNIKDENIFIYGRSIGTSPAIYLSSIRRPNALFVVSSFTSIRSVAGNLVGPLKYLLKDRFFSKDYIKNVKCPIIFIHGKIDPLIPYKETETLVNLYKFTKEYKLQENMTHNDFNLEKDIIEPINEFIKKNCIVDKQDNDLNNIEIIIDKLHQMPKEIELYINSQIK